MHSIEVSNKCFRQLEKLRPKGRTMNLVIAKLLKEGIVTRKDVENFYL